MKNTVSEARALVPEFAARLMNEPSVAYHEDRVAAVVTAICREHELPCDTDQFGNFHIRSGRNRRSSRKSSDRPFYFVAHMDHPGFEVLSGNRGKNRLRIRFLGGVPDRYFRPGIPLVAHPGNIKGTLGEKLPGKKVFSMDIPGGYGTKPEIAVWNLKGFEMRGDRIRGRACDDLMGLASLLAGLVIHARADSGVAAYGLVTRAEEVGFHGALACAASSILPKNAVMISLENSRELPPVKIGRGVIIRSGDRISQFDSATVYFLSRVAEELKDAVAEFDFQKALMPGGACEASAFQHHGLTSAAMCIPLGNYHNCGPRDRIAEEYVSITDAACMAAMVAAVAGRIPDYRNIAASAAERMDRLTAEAVARLTHTPRRPG